MLMTGYTPVTIPHSNSPGYLLLSPGAGLSSLFHGQFTHPGLALTRMHIASKTRGISFTGNQQKVNM